jgi:hypothetical protein
MDHPLPPLTSKDVEVIHKWLRTPKTAGSFTYCTVCGMMRISRGGDQYPCEVVIKALLIHQPSEVSGAQ